MNVELRANADPDALRTRESVLLPPGEARLLRGMTDMAALARAHHDHAFYLAHLPPGEEAGAMYHALEEMRVALLGAQKLLGVRNNLHTMFAQRPPMPTSLPAFLLRRHVTGEEPPGEVPPLDEKSKTLLARMREALEDQALFSSLSRQWIDYITGLETGGQAASTACTNETEEATENRDSTGDASDDTALDAAPEMSAAPSPASDPSAWGEMPVDATAGDMMLPQGEDTPTPTGTYPSYMEDAASREYRIYTSRHDEIIAAHRLAGTEELVRLRGQLDDRLAELRGTFAKFSSQLQRVLLARQRRSWEFDLEEGVLNSARLARMVVSPEHNRVFKQQKEVEFRDTVVSLLLDNSGSMRGRPITLAALSTDILAKTLERAGVKVEILGFTTCDWKGGDAFRDWVRAGKPAHPGRLGDIRHIIYKSADQPFSRARRNLGLMLKDGILKENIDGEALLWAHHRLLARPEKRRILMVISDGAPVDDSTLSANGAAYLDRHLREVIGFIEKRGKVELLAIGIGHDVTRYYPRSVTISDVSRLGETMTKELVELFKRK